MRGNLKLACPVEAISRATIIIFELKVKKDFHGKFVIVIQVMVISLFKDCA